MSDLTNSLREVFRGRLKINEVLANQTTFKIGGPADFFVEIRSKEEMIKAVNLVKAIKIPVFILGGGSNILVSDSGFRGLVIKNRIEGIKILGCVGGGGGRECEVRKVKIEAGSGTMMNRLVRFTIEEGLEGIEDFLGLPGTVGGAVFGNSHWKGKKINDYVSDAGKIENVILGATFELSPAKDKAALWRRAEEALEYRKKTQPQFPSAGCIFKNIDKIDAERLKTPGLTRSAGYLIDQCNLKGKKEGGAQISSLHGNFIVNLNRAKATDVIELIRQIKAKVKEKFDISLKEEIKYVGFNTNLNESFDRLRTS